MIQNIFNSLDLAVCEDIVTFKLVSHGLRFEELSQGERQHGDIKRSQSRGSPNPAYESDNL